MQTTKQTLIGQCDFIFSKEDDHVEFVERQHKAEAETGSRAWRIVFEGDDYDIRQNGPYFMIVDCGIPTLYKKRPLQQLSLFPDYDGQNQ